MRLLILLMIIAGAGPSLTAQRVTGVVMDEMNHMPVRLASVTILSQPDSFIVSFTRTANDGSFNMKLPGGRYRYIVIHPNYIDYSDSLLVKGDSNVNLGEIKMLSRSIALKEFVVKRNLASIKLRGDTLEYVADSFKLVQNASVEDLLKVLPGVQVNKNGEISAQGQTVQKVYVDGEEFFGDDPTLATQNLKADAVDKVQVFDEKSEEANFTGFDDGESKKAINIKLKEGRNKGVFGKVRAGGGTDERVNSQVMANSFKGPRKLSGFGLYSNTGQAGLGYSDRESFGDGGGGEYNSEEGYYYWSGDDDENSRFYGQGVPRILHTGLHFSNKWNENQNKLNLNYRFKQQITDATNRSNTEIFLPDSSLFNFERNNSHNDRRTHRLNGRFDFVFDTTFNLNFKLKATLNDERSRTHFFSDNVGQSGTFISQSERVLNNNRIRSDMNAELTLRKKLKKKGRTFSLFSMLADAMTDADNYLSSANRFYGANDSTEFINQYKTTDDNRLTFTGRTVYTEPLGSKFFLEFSYKLQRTVSSLDRNTYNTTGPVGDILGKNDSLSNSFRFDNTIHTGGLALRYNYKRVMFNMGLSVAEAGFYQNDLVRDQDRRYYQRNYFPSAMISIKGSKNPNANLRLRYNGFTNQPRIEQVQPLTDNTDPMNVTIGNPALKQEYTNDVSLSYNYYKPIANKGFWSWMSFGNTLDRIVMSQQIDEYGRRINQFVNLDGNYRLSTYMSYFFRLNKIKTRVEINLNAFRNQDVSLVFGKRSLTVTQKLEFGTDLSYMIEKRFEINISPNVSLTNSTNSLQRSDFTYLSFEPDFAVSWYSKKGMEITTDFEYNFREKTPPFNTNFNQFIWNAGISRKLLKDKSLEIEFYVYDILKQNRGYQRFVYQSYATERFYNTVTRYFQLTLTWNFHKGAAIPGRDND